MATGLYRAAEERNPRGARGYGRLRGEPPARCHRRRLILGAGCGPEERLAQGRRPRRIGLDRDTRSRAGGGCITGAGPTAYDLARIPGLAHRLVVAARLDRSDGWEGHSP